MNRQTMFHCQWLPLIPNRPGNSRPCGMALLLGWVFLLASFACGGGGGGGSITPPADPPVIQFSASPASITLGQASTLSWSVSSATSLSIDNGIGAVASIGSRQVTPVVTTTYSFSATGPGGARNTTATVTVTSQAVTVSLNPTAANLQTGQPQSFSATVAGSANTAVTWSVIEGGGGTVTSVGLYTAPSTAGTYHVRATSMADTSKFGEALVTVTNSSPVIMVNVTPSSANLQVSQTHHFSATVTGNPDTTVTWSVEEAGGGTITSAGLYTAPGTAETYHVRATSNADPGIAGRATVAVVTTPPPVAGHPRLWITPADVARLRAWAVPSNPFWQNGLLPNAESAKADMDANRVPQLDSGGNAYSDYFTESYARLFAFMSQVHPDAAARVDYAQRARTLLMHALNEAAKGVAANQPFRDTEFSVNDRSRWVGESFGLTVDWIYPMLSAQDKATIRTVFLRWCAENIGELAYIHPEPIGVLNNPMLTANRKQVRWANNNYFNAHMRNLGLMSMALDAGDDAGGSLKAYLMNATGAYLYILEDMWRTEVKGGLLAEGFEYSPQSLGYQAQFLWALKTAGMDDTAVYGPQVAWTHPIWNDVLPAFLHSLSPQTVIQNPAVGPIYLPSWYGSAQDYRGPDMIAAFAPLAFRAMQAGDVTTAQAIRWIQTFTPPGGQAAMVDDRVRRGDFLPAMFYFMVFDPAAAAPADPRPALPNQWLAEGVGRLLARTDWTAHASWFSFACGWKVVDHQTADALNFEFYRKGEWLTKHRIGYDFDYALSDNHNGLAIENGTPDHSDGYRGDIWRRGSQWILSPVADPPKLRFSTSTDFVYALGDATNLYNSSYENVGEVSQASRSIIWLKPDHIVVYDRAATTTPNRFKRFWLQFPFALTVTGNQAAMTTAGGQRCIVTTLLPAGAILLASPNPNEVSGAPANGETMAYRLRVEDPANPESVRFLHVLQGADGATPISPTTLVQSSSGTAFSGVTVAGSTFLFPVNLGEVFAGTSWTVPNGLRQVITGLTPGASYAWSFAATGGNRTLTLQPIAGAGTADSAGVLVLPAN